MSLLGFLLGAIVMFVFVVMSKIHKRVGDLAFNAREFNLLMWRFFAVRTMRLYEKLRRGDGRPKR